MVRHRLVPHPSQPDPPPIAIAAEATRPHPDTLRLHYRLTGDLDALRIPPPSAPARRDELWRRTCFEAFIRGADDPAYIELNLSPSTEWAAYMFHDTRAGMRPAAIPTPAIVVHRAGDALTLTTELAIPDLPSDRLWRLALTAVIEDHTGRTTHWALHHPTPTPDFHHPDGFVLELPPDRSG